MMQTMLVAVAASIGVALVREGKLYLNLNKAILAKFNEDLAGNIAKADKN